MFGILVGAVLERDVYICGLWKRPPRNLQICVASVCFGSLSALWIFLPYTRRQTICHTNWL